ncbi:transglutaminase-like cysteine peptidase [Porticoccaceae bacterium]|nr:transglutaminase-like cysteine peptidase [Porticoccaceae bacterium]
MLKSTQIIIAQQGKASNLTAAILSLLLIGNLAQASPSTINEPLLGQVHQEYGESAQTRLRQWQQIVNYAIGKPKIEQLALANNFINQAQFIDSPYYQDGFDFRLSPMAFLILGAGDSEEFSIAKYFTLREMGIHSNKLRLTYTEIQANNASHMVLAYYGADDAEPLVLDYLDKTVRPMSQRQDIRPI